MHGDGPKAEVDIPATVVLPRLDVELDVHGLAHEGLRLLDFVTEDDERIDVGVIAFDLLEDGRPLGPGVAGLGRSVGDIRHLAEGCVFDFE